MKQSSTRHSYFVGVTLVFAAAVLWSLNGALIKLIHEDGQGPHAVLIAFYRSLFAGLFLLTLARGKFHTLKRNSERATEPTPASARSCETGIPHQLIHRSLFGLRPAAIACVVFFTLMTACFALAATKTEAANAIILQYTSTFWVFGLSPWLLREKARTEDLWILGLAMIGIGVIFGGRASTNLIGLLIALAAGLFYALNTMTLRLLRDSDSAAVIVLNNLGSVVLLLPVALLVGGLMISPRALLLLIVMGVVQFGLPYYLFTLGLVRVPAYQAALITLAEPVLVPLWTYLAVRETVPLTTIIGGGVILAALILFVRAARKSRGPPVAETAP